ncbi:MAG: ABC transporter ATP-binding protein [Leptospiraceae bacterium]|nr:ABC transporter ATP-binding protein [Leptospiraceae bacterium]MDW7975762.1 ABC transporter ATP-binding protein [Leptospiraceae bacterium]
MKYDIEAYNIKKLYQNFWALKGVNFLVPEGKFVSLLGPNGAGKTTLLEILEGLQTPTEGNVKILGREWNPKNERFLKSMIGITLQETRFPDKQTVREILTLFASIHQVKKERIDEVLYLLGLEEKQHTLIEHLSGGQKQRLSLAIAILHQPKILFLDEPTVGLDPEARKNIWNILIQLKNQSKSSIVLTTHYMEEAEVLSDYLYLINQGKIIVEGTLSEIYSSYQQFTSLVFQVSDFSFESKLLRYLEKEIQIIHHFMDKQHDKIHFIIKNEKDVLPLIKNLFSFFQKHSIDIKNFEIHKPNLNDVFLQLSGRGLKDDNEYD